MKFFKLHGLGNDFVLLDWRDRPDKTLTAEKARLITDRNLGVGCDQILILKPPRHPETGADVRMEIMNNDGTQAEMCGNGIRAVGLFIKKTPLKVETLAGLQTITMENGQYRVNMGKPELQGHGEAEGHKYVQVSMGNPHAIILTEDLQSPSLNTLGPAIETHSNFPHRTNVEFVKMESKTFAHLRVWERGAGWTLACGSGACATAAALISEGLGQSPLTIRLPGGNLLIEWDGKGDLFMTGPATYVYEGCLHGID